MTEKSMKMQKFQKQQKGFTLIELMIVIAIVGILAAVAVPMYSQYTNKAKFSEVVASVDPVKTAIDLCYQTQGNSLANCDTYGKLGLTETDMEGGQYVNTVKITANSAVITATATGINGNASTYTLTPTTNGNSLKWAKSCSDSALC